MNYHQYIITVYSFKVKHILAMIIHTHIICVSLSLGKIVHRYYDIVIDWQHFLLHVLWFPKYWLNPCTPAHWVYNHKCPQVNSSQFICSSNNPSAPTTHHTDCSSSSKDMSIRDASLPIMLQYTTVNHRNHFWESSTSSFIRTLQLSNKIYVTRSLRSAYSLAVVELSVF